MTTESIVPRVCDWERRKETRKKKIEYRQFTGRGALAAVCLHSDQSRFLNLNNLSNLPFDLFAENTALVDL